MKKGSAHINPLPDQRQSIVESIIYSSVNSSNQERVLCAAIHYDDGRVYLSQPRNVKTGYIVSGLRHVNCILLNKQLTGRKTCQEDRQGFLTSRNRFINRCQAAKLAFKSKQVTVRFKSLLSEHLY